MKVPTHTETQLHIRRWTNAQGRKDVRAMEAMLQPDSLNLWWYSIDRTGEWKQWNSTAHDAIEMILQKLNLVGTPPPRLSEIAMAEADKMRKAERKRRGM